MRSLWVGVTGFAGALSRYQVEGWISRRTEGAFPWGTLVVNVSGCFLLGCFMALLTERFVTHHDLRVALTVGFVGAYTTFSTFAYETLRLGQEGAIGLAAINVAGSVLAGVVAVWLGTVTGRAI